jgi:hypothetical protein
MKIIGHKSERTHKTLNSVQERDLLAAVDKLNTYITLAAKEENKRCGTA